MSFLQKKIEPTYGLTSKKEEVVNIITHGLGIPFSIAALVLLLNQALYNQNWEYTAAVMIYGITMLFTYTTSTIYHSLYKVRPQRRNKFHLLDHVAIYLFIAGSYTPIALFVLPGIWSPIVLTSVWVLALAGVLYKVFLLGRFPKISLIIYLAMGWLIVIAFRPLFQSASQELLFWIFAGGACYTIGTIFFSLKKIKFSHGIWHLLVLAGTICHFIGIYYHV
jgi:hemolysin III